VDPGRHQHHDRRDAHPEQLELVQARQEKHREHRQTIRRHIARYLSGALDGARYRFFNKIGWVSFLDYLDYRKAECVQTLVDELGYRPYPYKHYESVFTRFYQGYILPTKFGVDKRSLHLSTLICSGQMTRDEAVEDLRHSPYPSEALLQEDREYFLKKMGWSNRQLEEYLAKPAVSHDVYGSEKRTVARLSWLYRNTVKRMKGQGK
jgi:hypothetical protein